MGYGRVASAGSRKEIRQNLRRGFLVHCTRSSSRTLRPDTGTPSATSSDRFKTSLPPYPPSRPPAAMTRWHGTSDRRHSRMMLPTARAARGRPAIAATSPYVATRPGGMRRTIDRTRRVNNESAGIVTFGSQLTALGVLLFLHHELERPPFRARQRDPGQRRQRRRDVGRRGRLVVTPRLDAAPHQDDRHPLIVRRGASVCRTAPGH